MCVIPQHNSVNGPRGLRRGDSAVCAAGIRRWEFFIKSSNKKYFYESQAKKCTEFCCGGVEISHDALGKTSMNNKNHYLVSIGTGYVYEGPAKEIQKEIKNDLDKAAFGSEEQTKGIEGLKKFNAIVAEREPIKGSALDSKKSQEELPSSKVPSTHKISK